MHETLVRLGQPDVPEVVLLPPRDLELALELGDAFLQVVVVDEVAVVVLEAVLACTQRDAFPVLLLLLRFRGAVFAGGERPHVMFFQERFALVPRSAAGGMEETLGEEFGEKLVLALVVFEAAENVGAFVDNAGVDPGGRKAPEVGALPRLVDPIFFALLLGENGEPAGIDFFEDRLDLVEAVSVDRAVEFEDGVDGELGAYRGFEFEEGGAGREDISGTGDDILGEVSSRDSSKDDRCERLFGPLRGSVEDEMDTFEEFECR